MTNPIKQIRFIFNDVFTYTNDQYVVIMNHIEHNYYDGILTLVDGTEYKIQLQEPLLFNKYDNLYDKYNIIIGCVYVNTEVKNHEVIYNLVLVDDFMHFYQGIYLYEKNNDTFRGVLSLIKNI
jgi:hypothetical protein